MFWINIMLLVLGIVFYTFAVMTATKIFSGYFKEKRKWAKRSSQNLGVIIGNFNFVKSVARKPVLTNELYCEKVWDLLDVGVRYTDDRRDHVYEVIDKDYDNGTFTVKAITTFSYLESPDYVAVYEPKSEAEREEYRQDLKRRENAKTILKEFD